jgi:hypothetical protein
MGINEKSFKTLAEAEAAGVSVRCLGTWVAGSESLATYAARVRNRRRH